MNAQGPGKIEWTEYTWNPLGGCRHACRWTIGGETVRCYAERTAETERLRPFYPEGFAAMYWHPERLEEPLRLKKPARIFLDSMSDLMGAWVPDEYINAVLDVCRRADWHTFQLLTKNPPRLKEFRFPRNVWAGISMPADQMNGRALSDAQKRRWLETAINSLGDVREWAATRWISFEPLSWDVADIVAEQRVIDWAVIGAGTNGRTAYQPDPAHVRRLLAVLDAQRVPVFFKGNLKGNAAAAPWREEFPQ